MKRQSILLVLLGLCAAGVLAVSAAGLISKSGPSAAASSNDAQSVALAPAGPLDKAGLRCRHCAWIESMREVRPGVAKPLSAAVYEYTVRRSDGSSGVFEEEDSGAWRVGRRLVFIGGADARH